MAWRFPSWLKCFCISMGLLRNLISGHAHGLYCSILNTHGLPSNGLFPMNAITLLEILGATNKPLYFNIEWDRFNFAYPFTIPTNPRKFSASTACILNVAHFVDSPPTSAFHFSIFFENYCVVPAGPNFSRPPSSQIKTYSPSLKIADDMMMLLPEALLLFLLFPPFRCLPPLYYVAW